MAWEIDCLETTQIMASRPRAISFFLVKFQNYITAEYARDGIYETVGGDVAFGGKITD